jgi:hypothetical protein
VQLNLFTTEQQKKSDTRILSSEWGMMEKLRESRHDRFVWIALCMGEDVFDMTIAALNASVARCTL